MFWEKKEETSSVQWEKSCNGERVKAREVGGGEVGGKCKLIKEQRKVLMSVVGGPRREAKLLLCFLCSNRGMRLHDLLLRGSAWSCSSRRQRACARALGQHSAEKH